MYMQNWVYMSYYSLYFSLESHSRRIIVSCVSVQMVPKAKDCWNVGKGKRVLLLNESLNYSTAYPKITHSKHLQIWWWSASLNLLSLILLFVCFFSACKSMARTAKNVYADKSKSQGKETGSRLNPGRSRLNLKY